MTRLALFVGTALLALSSLPAAAACNGDTSTETILGAGSGAAVGGLASHNLGGAAVGGVARGFFGNPLWPSNNRGGCPPPARAGEQGPRRAPPPSPRLLARRLGDPPTSP